MHDIEPWWGWRGEYVAEEDRHSPFYGRVYDEFRFSSQIYNYYIHPQWDSFGSETLYCKLLYVSYLGHFAFIELIGEWNDGIGNDIMFLKRTLIDPLIDKKVYRFVLFCDNVLNYHGDDDSYYEEWYDDVKEDHGWICLVNCFDHVISEMNRYRLYYYLNYSADFNEMNWRTQKPEFILQGIINIMKDK